MPAERNGGPDQDGCPRPGTARDAAARDNFFDIFSLPFSFDINLEQLETNYHAILRRVHPDFFATASHTDKKTATQIATVFNEAYHTLKTPLLRAQHMLSLLQRTGPSVQETEDPSFLAQQIKMRQKIEENYKARQKKELLEKTARFQEELATLYQQFSAACTPQANIATAQKTLYRIFFYERIITQVHHYLFELLDTNPPA